MECPHWMEPPPHKSKEKKKELQKKIRQLRQKKKKVMKVTSNLGVSLCHTRPSKGTGQWGWTQPSNAGSFVTYSPQRVGLLPADAQQVGCGWTELS